MDTDRIEKTALLQTSLEKAWRAVSDSAQFGSWFGVRFDGPFEPGARMLGIVVPTTVDPEVAEKQKKYSGISFELTVEEMEPERLFSFRWHPFAIDPAVDYDNEPTTLVTFLLEETKGGVTLTITETGFDQLPPDRRASAFSANESGWTLQITMVGKYVAQGA